VGDGGWKWAEAESGASFVFLGSFRHAIDPKGRLSIPKRYLDSFPEFQARVFFGTRGLDPCLYLYPPDGWVRVVAQFRNLVNPGDPRHRAFIRKFLSTASELPVDAAGRILLPKSMREEVGIQDDVMILGVDDHLELWSPEHWAPDAATAAADFPELGKQIFSVRA